MPTSYSKSFLLLFLWLLLLCLPQRADSRAFPVDRGSKKELRTEKRRNRLKRRIQKRTKKAPKRTTINTGLVGWLILASALILGFVAMIVVGAVLGFRGLLILGIVLLAIFIIPYVIFMILVIGFATAGSLE